MQALSMQDGTGWRDALAAFLASLSSLRTARNYAASIRTLFTAPAAPQTVEALSADVLAAWRGALLTRATLAPGTPGRISPATVNRHIAAARSFLAYWRARGRSAVGRDALEVVLKPMRAHVERPYQVLTRAESEALIAAAAHPAPVTAGRERLARRVYAPVYTGRDAGLAQRDEALIVLALATGLRCAELAALDVGDVRHEVYDDGAAWWITVRGGKGGKDRIVPLSDEDAATAGDYLAATGRSLARASDRDTPLWLNRRGGRLSADQARAIISGAADRATASGGIAAGKSISPHALRHSYAVDLLRGDAPTGRRPATVLEVSKLLGHASIQTTMRYVDHEDRRRYADLAPTISRRRVQP